jgi:hypothetical protein
MLIIILLTESELKDDYNFSLKYLQMIVDVASARLIPSAFVNKLSCFLTIHIDMIS